MTFLKYTSHSLISSFERLKQPISSTLFFLVLLCRIKLFSPNHFNFIFKQCLRFTFLKPNHIYILYRVKSETLIIVEQYIICAHTYQITQNLPFSNFDRLSISPFRQPPILNIKLYPLI